MSAAGCSCRRYQRHYFLPKPVPLVPVAATPSNADRSLSRFTFRNGEGLYQMLEHADHEESFFCLLSMRCNGSDVRDIAYRRKSYALRFLPEAHHAKEPVALKRE
jgi:hypothetical protein